MEMKEKWLMPGAVVPVDVETTAALVAEIKRLIGVVGNVVLKQAEQAEEQKPVAKAVVSKRATIEHHITDIDLTLTESGKRLAGGEHFLYTAPPPRQPLTDEEISDLWCKVSNTDFVTADTHEFARAIEAKLKEKNA